MRCSFGSKSEILILFYLNVCCHMWAKEYHSLANNASEFLASITGSIAVLNASSVQPEPV